MQNMVSSFSLRLGWIICLAIEKNIYFFKASLYYVNDT